MALLRVADIDCKCLVSSDLIYTFDTTETKSGRRFHCDSCSNGFIQRTDESKAAVVESLCAIKLHRDTKYYHSSDYTQSDLEIPPPDTRGLANR